MVIKKRIEEEALRDVPAANAETWIEEHETLFRI